MPVWWTKRSLPPSSGVTKPKPLSSLNHLTVPVAIAFLLRMWTANARDAGRRRLRALNTNCDGHDARRLTRSLYRSSEEHVAARGPLGRGTERPGLASAHAMHPRAPRPLGAVPPLGSRRRRDRGPVVHHPTGTDQAPRRHRRLPRRRGQGRVPRRGLLAGVPPRQRRRGPGRRARDPRRRGLTGRGDPAAVTAQPARAGALAVSAIS